MPSKGTGAIWLSSTFSGGYVGGECYWVKKGVEVGMIGEMSSPQSFLALTVTKRLNCLTLNTPLVY